MFIVNSFIVVTSGDYSDYSIHDCFKVLRDFCPASLQAEFRSDMDGHEQGRYINPDRFIAWLVAFGYVQQIDYHEWNVDSNMYTTAPTTPINFPTEIKG